METGGLHESSWQIGDGHKKKRVLHEQRSSSTWHWFSFSTRVWLSAYSAEDIVTMTWRNTGTCVTQCSGWKFPVGIFSVLTDLPAKGHITHQAPESYDIGSQIGTPYHIPPWLLRTNNLGAGAPLASWSDLCTEPKEESSYSLLNGPRDVPWPWAHQVAISSSTSTAWRCEAFPPTGPFPGAAEPSRRISVTWRR